MNSAQLNMLFLPITALLLVIVFYTKFLQSVGNKKDYKRLIRNMVLLSYILNLGWELLQVPLYENMIFDNHTLLCAMASIADVIMVLLLYFVFALIYKDPFWIMNLSFKRVVITMVVGTAGAILSEIHHINVGNWTYTKSMPLLPIANVGLVPVLQFCILPVLIYFLDSYTLKLQT